jgi:hypothetical protein
MTTAGIEVREQLRTGQQVVGGRGEGVLVGAAVDVQPHELLGRGVGDGPHCQVSRRQPTTGIRHHDVGGLDISMHPGRTVLQSALDTILFLRRNEVAVPVTAC